MTTSASAAPEPAPMIPEWTFGDRLRKVRRDVLSLNQSEFAAELGTNQKTYAAWELDMTSPRNMVALAKRIEALSGVPASWMLGLDDGTPFRAAAPRTSRRRAARSSSAPETITHVTSFDERASVIPFPLLERLATDDERSALAPAHAATRVAPPPRIRESEDDTAA